MIHTSTSALTVLVTFIFQSQAHAVVGCPMRKDILQDLAEVNAPLKVTQVDNADRRTAGDYAADHNMTPEEIKQRYAASGDLNCNGKKCQGSVTLARDVITTSAHCINPGGKKCIDLAKPPKCSFTVEVGGEKSTYETAGVFDSGWDCMSTDREHQGSDWAIMRLARKVDSRIQPYKIDGKFQLKMARDTPVTAVGRSQDWPPGNKSNDMWDHARHYGDCQTKMVIGSSVQTNCDISGGSSGGALLTQGPDPTLIAVHEMDVYGGDGCPKPNFAKKSGAYSQCWATASALIAFDFADAVAKAAQESKARP